MKAAWSVGLALLLLLAPHLAADTVTLKTGEKLTGKITGETPQEVSIDVQVSASIVDARTVPRSEIASVDKASPEDLAWQSVQRLKLGDSSMPVPSYDAGLSTLQAFVNQFPTSPHVAEAGQTLAAFADEQHRVQGGEVKIGGRWLTRAQAEKERYQISAQILFAQMTEAARRNDFAGALNLYDNLEKNYAGARVFPDAIDLARRLLPGLKSAADRTLLNWKTLKVERTQGTALASEPQRTELRNAQAREEKAADDSVDAAQKAGLNWAPLQAIGEKNATYLSKRAPVEAKRLEALPVAKMRESLKLADAGVDQLSHQDNASATSSFRDALSLWSVNEVAVRAQKEMNAKAKATPEPVVAAAPAATPVPEATPVPTPVAHATPRPAVPLETPAATADDSEKGGSSKMLIYGGLAVVVLGLVFAATKFLKKKPSEDETPVE